MREFGAWLDRQHFEHIVLIAGNNEPLFEHDPEAARAALTGTCPRVTYLQDTGCEIGGLSFWGTPWQPRFVGSFNLGDDSALAEEWALIPAGIDVLISHTPPAGILDRTSRGQSVGCRELRGEVVARIRPRLHITSTTAMGA